MIGLVLDDSQRKIFSRHWFDIEQKHLKTFYFSGFLEESKQESLMVVICYFLCLQPSPLPQSRRTPNPHP